MPSIFSILIPIVGIAVGALAAFLILRGKNSEKEQNNQQDQNFQLLNQKFNDLATLIDRSKTSTDQALRDTVKMVSDQLKDSRESTERSSRNVHQQVQMFTSGLTKLSENIKGVHESIKGVASFQDIFKAPKLRGIWGEASLEASLAQYFSHDNYKIQHYFKNGEAVDAVLKLPNDLLLPIDSKFNWENFEKMINAKNDADRIQHRKTFLSDVKKKIEEISSKYIKPQEGTLDVALMYVPAETVYYEIVNSIRDVDLSAYARARRVILVSPNTFMLSISAIRHWLQDVHLNRQTKNIMNRIGGVIKDAQKLDLDFKRLGKHLSDARSSYENSEKRLSLMTDRAVRVLEVGEKAEQVEEVRKEKAEQAEEIKKEKTQEVGK